MNNSTIIRMLCAALLSAAVFIPATPSIAERGKPKSPSIPKINRKNVINGEFPSIKSPKRSKKPKESKEGKFSTKVRNGTTPPAGNYNNLVGMVKHLSAPLTSSSRMVTGTLISPQVLITAAHGISEPVAPNYNPVGGAVVPSTDIYFSIDGATNFIQGAQIVRHPQYVRLGYGTNGYGAADIALVKLQAPARPATPFYLIPTTSIKGPNAVNLDFIGFGENFPGYVGRGTKRYAAMKTIGTYYPGDHLVSYNGSTLVTSTVTRGFLASVSRDASNQMPCKGDSGGSFYDPVTRQLVGAQNWAWGSDCTNYDEVAGSPYAEYITWIEDTRYALEPSLIAKYVLTQVTTADPQCVGYSIDITCKSGAVGCDASSPPPAYMRVLKEYTDTSNPGQLYSDSGCQTVLDTSAPQSGVVYLKPLRSGILRIRATQHLELVANAADVTVQYSPAIGGIGISQIVTPTPQPTSTNTPVFTATPTNTATAIPPTSTPTVEPSNTPTHTPLPTSTSTPVPTNTATVAPTNTPTAVATATQTAAGSPTSSQQTVELSASARYLNGAPARISASINDGSSTSPLGTLESLSTICPGLTNSKTVTGSNISIKPVPSAYSMYAYYPQSIWPQLISVNPIANTYKALFYSYQDSIIDGNITSADGSDLSGITFTLQVQSCTDSGSCSVGAIRASGKSKTIHFSSPVALTYPPTNVIRHVRISAANGYSNFALNPSEQYIDLNMYEHNYVGGVNFKVAFTNPGSVEGVIHAGTLSGKGIPGRQVYLRTLSGSLVPGGLLWTNADGKFKVPGVAPGQYKITAFDYYDNHPYATVGPINVTVASSPVQLDLVAADKSVASNMSRLNFKTQDANGQPLQGMTVGASVIVPGTPGLSDLTRGYVTTNPFGEGRFDIATESSDPSYRPRVFACTKQGVNGEPTFYNNEYEFSPAVKESTSSSALQFSQTVQTFIGTNSSSRVRFIVSGLSNVAGSQFSFSIPGSNGLGGELLPAGPGPRYEEVAQLATGKWNVTFKRPGAVPITKIFKLTDPDETIWVIFGCSFKDISNDFAVGTNSKYDFDQNGEVGLKDLTQFKKSLNQGFCLP